MILTIDSTISYNGNNEDCTVTGKVWGDFAPDYGHFCDADISKVVVHVWDEATDTHTDVEVSPDNLDTTQNGRLIDALVDAYIKAAEDGRAFCDDRLYDEIRDSKAGF